MNKAPVEQALISLIPTLNGPLPEELVQLSMSLLARSRNLAHSLKPEEEIARPYACTQLACDRLKTRLNLPALQPRPPCPPRIYKKLYKYLESAMPEDVTRGPATPRKTATHGSASAPTTPKTPLDNRRIPRRTARDSSRFPELPDWVMPTIRLLVKEFSYPFAAPHVIAGVESIFPLLNRMAAADESSRRRPTQGLTATVIDATALPHSRILALVAVVLFLVLSKMLDQDITPQQYRQWRDNAIASLLRCKAGESVTKEEILADIENLMPMAQEEGWLDMEWFLNIAPQRDSEEMDGVETTYTSASHSKSGSRKSIRDDFGSEYIGLGTMMQDATDYLGQRQREDFRRWKMNILAKIGEAEA
ncbi:uncharacterized protein EI97DRAFT_448452 [Westerdykella ornata]|uniref:ORC6 first cyclin-like domain-containing protein n=1 Tax=Westerdykella ornata TaxID=318751 RepID=A0A6A6JT71_WESOR|nr:uncharacterized protein EI97DRAFT_448452 [Westerdykella ornata]KAF2279811.1 hypothetical protein EI97DRAFT_448452 [Westerdykella ornata]